MTWTIQRIALTDYYMFSTCLNILKQARIAKYTFTQTMMLKQYFMSFRYFLRITEN